MLMENVIFYIKKYFYNENNILYKNIINCAMLYAALSFEIQQAMSRKLGNVWGTECLVLGSLCLSVYASMLSSCN